MAKLLMCTGRKNKVAAVIQHYLKLDKAKRITILGKKLKTKRMLVWSYDELKILFETKYEGPIEMPRNLVKGLDIFTIKDSTMVVVKFGTKTVEDPMLKPKMLALSRPFLSQNVTFQADHEEIRHSEYRIEHRCKGQIAGPVRSVLSFKDLLIREGLCEPSTVSYIF